jgi:drug/metabolite transporter (DMT)-like permease
MTDDRAGVLLAAGSGALLAAVVLMGKLALRTISPWGFTTFFFAFGAAWFALYLMIRGDWAAFRPSRKLLLAGLLITVIDGGYAFTWSAALSVLHPAVHGFLGHIADLLAATLGLIVLRERFSKLELLGMAVAFAGMFVMTARADSIALKGLILMVASGVFFAVNLVFVKRYTKAHSPQHLAFYRAVGIAVAMMAVSVCFFDFRLLVGREWILMPLLGLVGPFLNYLLFFHAVKKMEVGRVTVVRMNYSLIVLVGSVLFYGQLPRTPEIIGGLLVFVGAATMILEKTRLTRRVAS